MADARARLQDQRILLCVCGGIAAYKAAELVRRLRDAGAQVQVAMTQEAMRFVGTPTFQALSGMPVRTSLWDEAAEAAMGHIELARWADHVVVAPATANTLAKAHPWLRRRPGHHAVSRHDRADHGGAAMNHRMWLHPATQANVATLRERGVQVVGPEDGPLAEGESGPGRLSEPERSSPRWPGQGDEPARTPRPRQCGSDLRGLDPVRFIGNRSSGKMGFAVAAAAACQGAEVVLVAGPVSLPTPANVTRIDVRSAAQMHAAVLAALPADVYIGAAAVADFTPRASRTGQDQEAGRHGHAGAGTGAHPRHPRRSRAHAPRRPELVVGFAAETDHVEQYARGKLEKKRLDLIAANRVGIVGSGFESDENALVVYGRDGFERALGPAPKIQLADNLLELISARLG
jgi:phosphopantothenoylcysteine decarboxylase/phosphopantothenate--cysteine ligase